MLLYHGGTEIVEKPEVRQANRPVDFGDGFYTTSSLEQASKFAKIRAKFKNVPIGIVNVFEFDEKAAEGYKVLQFECVDESWFDFVVSCRRGGKEFQKFDLISGPVANDNVFRTLDFYEAGVYSKSQAMEHLLARRLDNQFVFLNNALITSLEFIKYIEVKR